MARRLKTYHTSSGFFDLAVAAPSMKAAAEAWGSRTNVFKQGFAKETRDPAIVAATMAKPGVVLRRLVGSNGPFTEHAELPKDLPVEKLKERPAKPQKELPAAKRTVKLHERLHWHSSESRSGANWSVGRKRPRGRRSGSGASS
jgi:colicin import membrane protein